MNITKEEARLILDQYVDNEWNENTNDFSDFAYKVRNHFFPDEYKDDFILTKTRHESILETFQSNNKT